MKVLITALLIMVFSLNTKAQEFFPFPQGKIGYNQNSLEMNLGLLILNETQIVPEIGVSYLIGANQFSFQHGLFYFPELDIPNQLKIGYEGYYRIEGIYSPNAVIGFSLGDNPLNLIELSKGLNDTKTFGIRFTFTLMPTWGS